MLLFKIMDMSKPKEKPSYAPTKDEQRQMVVQDVILFNMRIKDVIVVIRLR